MNIHKKNGYGFVHVNQLNMKPGSVEDHETRHAATHSHSHPPARYDRSCSTNASIVGMRALYHALRHLQKRRLSKNKT